MLYLQADPRSAASALQAQVATHANGFEGFEAQPSVFRLDVGGSCALPRPFESACVVRSTIEQLTILVCGFGMRALSRVSASRWGVLASLAREASRRRQIEGSRRCSNATSIAVIDSSCRCEWSHKRRARSMVLVSIASGLACTFSDFRVQRALPLRSPSFGARRCLVLAMLRTHLTQSLSSQSHSFASAPFPFDIALSGVAFLLLDPSRYFDDLCMRRRLAFLFYRL